MCEGVRPSFSMSIRSHDLSRSYCFKIGLHSSSLPSREISYQVTSHHSHYYIPCSFPVLPILVFHATVLGDFDDRTPFHLFFRTFARSFHYFCSLRTTASTRKDQHSRNGPRSISCTHSLEHFAQVDSQLRKMKGTSRAQIDGSES